MIQSYPEIYCIVFKGKVIGNSFTKEAILMNALKLRGKEVDICMPVDNDHAGDKVSCRWRSGFLIYVNTALVKLFSKKQSTV